MVCINLENCAIYALFVSFVLLVGLGGCARLGNLEKLVTEANTSPNNAAVTQTSKTGIWIHEGIGIGTLDSFDMYINTKDCVVIYVINNNLNEVNLRFFEELSSNRRKICIEKFDWRK